MLANCPVAVLPTIEDRLLAVAHRRRCALRRQHAPPSQGVKQALLRETASPLIQPAFSTGTRRTRAAGGWRRWRGRNQGAPEAYLVHKDCAEGASLDVMPAR